METLMESKEFETVPIDGKPYRNLIVNADDLGSKESVNYAIVNLLERKLINSSTLLANFPGFSHAVDLVHKKGLVSKIGIHLNLTESTPLHPNPIQREYLYHGVFKFREKFKRNPFYLAKEDRDYIYEELDLQIRKVKESGIPISHIDSHHHVHEFYSVTQIVVELARKHNISSIRIPNLDYSMFYKRLYKWMVVRFLKRNKLNYSDVFTNQLGFFDLHKKMSTMRSTERLEIMVHPDFGKDNLIIDKVANMEFGLEFLKDIQSRLI